MLYLEDIIKFVYKNEIIIKKNEIWGSSFSSRAGLAVKQ